MPTYHWTDCKPQRIIEWADDQDDPFGFLPNDWSHGEEVEGEGRLLWFGPSIDTLVHLLRLSDAWPNLQADMHMLV